MDATGRTHDDALHLLSPGGCALCAAAGDGVETWARAFVNEARADLDGLDAVRDALGFCPVHTRRMLADPSASWVLPAVALEVVDEGRSRLGGGLAGRRPGAVAVCPACVRAARSAAGAAGTLAATLTDERVRTAFAAAGGVCAPHLADLAAETGRGAGALRDAAAAPLLARLDDTSPDRLPDLVRAVAGEDPDATRRAAFAPALAALAAADDAAAAAGGGTALARLWLARATCPPCTAAAVAGWRYTAWLTGSPDAPGRGDPPSRQDLVLCEVHLTDAAQAGGPRAGAVVTQAVTAARSAAAAALQPAARRPGGFGRRDDRPAQGLGCRACAAAATAEQRAWDLLDAAAADADLAAAARSAHGLCLRHGLRTAAGHGPAGRLFAEVLDGRLAMLGWDLREGMRLGRWDTRFTPAGASTTAWRRATTLLDGRIDLGTPVG